MHLGVKCVAKGSRCCKFVDGKLYAQDLEAMIDVMGVWMKNQVGKMLEHEKSCIYKLLVGVKSHIADLRKLCFHTSLCTPTSK